MPAALVRMRDAYIRTRMYLSPSDVLCLTGTDAPSHPYVFQNGAVRIQTWAGFLMSFKTWFFVVVCPKRQDPGLRLA